MHYSQQDRIFYAVLKVFQSDRRNIRTSEEISSCKKRFFLLVQIYQSLWIWSKKSESN